MESWNLDSKYQFEILNLLEYTVLCSDISTFKKLVHHTTNDDVNEEMLKKCRAKLHPLLLRTLKNKTYSDSRIEKVEEVYKLLGNPEFDSKRISEGSINTTYSTNDKVIYNLDRDNFVLEFEIK